MNSHDHNTVIPGEVEVRLKKIKNPYLPYEYIFNLYEHMAGNSELSHESILHEIENLLTNIHVGPYFFITLTIDELAFLIEHNRYQEIESEAASGSYKGIDVHGTFNDKHIIFISETSDLVKKYSALIQDIIRYNPDKTFRLSSYAINNVMNKKDRRRLFILEDEIPSDKSPDAVQQAIHFVQERLSLKDITVPEAEIEAFLQSATAKFIQVGLQHYRKRTIENYLISWKKLKELMKKGEDIFITIDPNTIDDEPTPEKRIQVWLPREKFQENFGTINYIFERRGVPFTRQYFESFNIKGTLFIAFSTYISNEFLTPEVEDFFRNELYNRLILLKSTPVSVGEIKEILDTVKNGKDYVKLDLIEAMQKNKQKEYLIPLVLLLNDKNHDICNKAFGLIKHYLLNPDVRMKNDYYWSTLKNIFSAASVPFEREKDRPARTLSDYEIIQLIRFRDINYDQYREPVTDKQYLFIRINGIGIGKGGIRAHKSHVSFSGEGALATNMLFKTLGIGIPLYTTAKGGILGDIRFDDLSDSVRENARAYVLNAYADFLYYIAGTGPLSDVPAGDVGVGGDEIGIIYQRITDNAFRDIQNLAEGIIQADSSEARILRENFGVPVHDDVQIKKLAVDRDAVENYTASSITGKPGNKGLKLRSGATGRGMVEVLAGQQNYSEYSDSALWSHPSRIKEAIECDAEYTSRANKRMKFLTFSIQGFGKVGASFAGFLSDIGSTVKRISDVSGTVSNEQGIRNIALICDACKSGKNLSGIPREILGDAEFIPGNTILPLKAMVNVVVPAALEDVIISRGAVSDEYIVAREFDGDYLLQGANGPVTSDAEDLLAEMGKISFPDILANSGGVLASYLEWVNGLVKQFGYLKIHNYGFVHAILHNVVMHFHPEALTNDIHQIDETVYEYAFKFILRSSTIETINLSRSYKISMRNAYIALGIRLAAAEGRLSEQFKVTIERMRDGFYRR